MGVTEKFNAGEFCWTDMGTTDVAAAKTFYGEVMGWSFHDMADGAMAYTMCMVGERPVGAIYPQQEQQAKMGMPPHWLSYVSVTNCDETTANAKEHGATVHAPPFDVMDVGRMSVIQDPTGGVVATWQPAKHHGFGRTNEPGAACWFELLTRDTAKAQAFYTQTFGWTAKDSNMPDFKYTQFNVGEKGIGGMMPINPNMGDVPVHWAVYFAVADCDMTVARATKMGGTVIMPPTEIPTVGKFAVIRDPQGGAFAVIKLSSPM